MTTRIRMRDRRVAEIICELCRLSRRGWTDIRPEQYLPLERELRRLLAEKIEAENR